MLGQIASMTDLSGAVAIIMALPVLVISLLLMAVCLKIAGDIRFENKWMEALELEELIDIVVEEGVEINESDPVFIPGLSDARFTSISEALSAAADLLSGTDKPKIMELDIEEEGVDRLFDFSDAALV